MNNTISKWLGECRHEGYNKANSYTCTKCGEYIYAGHENTDYSDPSAWTQELYGRIEEAVLANMFITFLMGGVVLSKVHRPKKLCFDAMSKTPAQKAQALARAIEETE